MKLEQYIQPQFDYIPIAVAILLASAVVVQKYIVMHLEYIVLFILESILLAKGLLNVGSQHIANTVIFQLNQLSHSKRNGLLCAILGAETFIAVLYFKSGEKK